MKDKPIKETRSEQERLLDEALAETFPASDPVSVQQIVIVGQVERPLRGGGGSGVKTSVVKTEHRDGVANRLGSAGSERISAA
jgi:hypothetical protein